MAGQREGMACPRPRRVDLLDAILFEDATSPPYFIGSPPKRSTNPLPFDARFAASPPRFHVASAASAHFNAAVPAAHFNAGSAPPSNCGPHPAAVRIEGFDCLGADRRRNGRGITAVA